VAHFFYSWPCSFEMLHTKPENLLLFATLCYFSLRRLLLSSHQQPNTAKRTQPQCIQSVLVQLAASIFCWQLAMLARNALHQTRRFTTFCYFLLLFATSFFAPTVESTQAHSNTDYIVLVNATRCQRLFCCIQSHPHVSSRTELECLMHFATFC
jgi:hypothetical protein